MYVCKYLITYLLMSIWQHTIPHIDHFKTMLLTVLQILSCSSSYGLLVLLDGISILIMKVDVKEGEGLRRCAVNLLTSFYSLFQAV
jgi:hypothetical protein